MGNNSSYEYVVGIDFGSAGIGFAYASNIKNREINPVLSNLEGQGDDKVPNEIILDNEFKNVLAFGNECSKYIDTHRDNHDSYCYFKDIKMNLYNKNYFIKATNEKVADIEIIISKILKKISEEAIEHIQSTIMGTLDRNKIKWVVTIPAIWTEKSKEIMIKASRNAGLINNQTDLSLFLALEPEVAGIFYFSNLNSKTNSHKKAEELLNPYIICDMGAGTVDICTLRKEKNEDALIEVYPPLGGNYGGNFINQEFIKRLIVELFGNEKLEKVKYDRRYKDFEKNIETLKKQLDDKAYECHLNCRIFKDENNSSDTLDHYITAYKQKKLDYKYDLKRDKQDEWDLIFPSQVLLDITKKISYEIFQKLDEVYYNVKNVQTIFTGAGSNNKILLNYIQKHFKDKGINFEIKKTIQPEVSILKGAAIYGFKTNIIRRRRPKYTIGVAVSNNWDEKLHKNGGIKIFDKTEKKWKCINLFKKFITINKDIEYNEIISHDFKAAGSKPVIAFYKTLKENCKYIDEKDKFGNLIIYKFGAVKFDIKNFDKAHPQVRINMKMGGTYIYATAIYLNNNIEIQITQNFEDKDDLMVDEPKSFL